MNSAESESIRTRLKSFIPQSLLCLREGYSLETLRKDLMAGFAVGIIAFPLAMAYAIGANIPPEKGIFTAIIAGFLISFLGGSRVQIGGPTSTFIIILYSIISRHGFEGMVIAALMAGIMLIIFGCAGFGTFIKYIPYPVVTGLTTGISVTLFTSQLKDFFGIRLETIPIDFVEKWKAYFAHMDSWDPASFCIGMGALAIIIFFRRYKPQFPGAVVALGLAALITWFFEIDIPTIGSKYGELPRHFPSPALPHCNFEDILSLFPEALTIALLISIESLLSGVVSEGMTGWKHQANGELVAQGVANITSVIFGGIPAAGGLARTAANVKNGAQTPIAGITHVITIFFIFFFFAPLTSQIPLCALAAVLFMIAWGMSEIHHFFHLFTAPKRDVAVLLTVFTLTVLVNITVAVQVGTILAAFLFMKQMSDLSDVISPTKYFEEDKNPGVDPDAISKKDIPYGVEIFEINGPFFFGVADRLKNLLNGLERPPKVFILRMRKVPTIDASGMHALEEFYLECRRQGTILLLSGVRKHPLKNLKRYHLDELIGHDHIFSHINLALEFAKEIMRQEKYRVSKRVFQSSL